MKNRVSLRCAQAQPNSIGCGIGFPDALTGVGGFSRAHRSALLDASSHIVQRRWGASLGACSVGRSHQKGFGFGIRHAFSLVSVQPVIQQVIPLNFFIEAPMMEQLELRLLCRLDAPSVVPHHLIERCNSYRDAVKLCWQLRRIKNMTQRRLAEESGLYAPHVTGYLRDGKSNQRDLPGSAVKAFEWTYGNTAITQWHSMGAKLTVLEELQAERIAA